jgi:hypothetical protein
MKCTCNLITAVSLATNLPYIGIVGMGKGQEAGPVIIGLWLSISPLLPLWCWSLKSSSYSQTNIEQPTVVFHYSP